MTRLAAGIVVDGRCDAPALVSHQPINFPAAMCKISNLLPFKRSEIRDAHHELFGHSIAGKVLVFPSCIGSTYTGLVLLELIGAGRGPAAIVVGKADPLLVSGVVLSAVWAGRSIPVLEHPGEGIFNAIHTGDRVRIEPGAAEIVIERPTPAN